MAVAQSKESMGEVKPGEPLVLSQLYFGAQTFIAAFLNASGLSTPKSLRLAIFGACMINTSKYLHQHFVDSECMNL